MGWYGGTEKGRRWAREVGWTTSKLFLTLEAHDFYEPVHTTYKLCGRYKTTLVLSIPMSRRIRTISNSLLFINVDAEIKQNTFKSIGFIDLKYYAVPQILTT